MQRLLMILIVLVAGILALGFYRNWFGVTTEGSAGQHRITFTVDEDKIKADEKRAREQIPGIGTSKPAEGTKN